MTGPALPLWLLVPPAAVLMLLMAAYIQAMAATDMPGSRRRIRTAGCLIMMVLQPLLVYLFAIGSAQRPRPFVFTWALVMGLLGILVVLALLDVLNNARLARVSRQQLRDELRSLREQAARLAQSETDAANPPDLRLTDDPADEGGRP